MRKHLRVFAKTPMFGWEPCVWAADVLPGVAGTSQEYALWFKSLGVPIRVEVSEVRK